MQHYKKAITRVIYSVSKIRPALDHPEDLHLIKDLHLSPLSLLEICIRLEKEFKITIDDDQYFRAQSVAEIYTLVIALCEAKQSSQ